VWSRLQRRLHWGVAAVVLVQFLTQDVMREAMKQVAVDQAPGFGAFIILTLHVWGGAVAGFLVLWRIRLRMAGRVQKRPLAAHLNHAVLYLSVLVMSGSGALHYGAGVDWAVRWHVVGKWLLVGAVCLHLTGSLWHTVVKRDGVLAAMLGRDNDR
jgi:cytochrome b561